MTYRSILTTLVLTLVFAVSAAAQDPMMMPHNEERYKELQSMRVWAIIQTLDLDARSERGSTILSIINEASDRTRELLLNEMQHKRQLHDLITREAIDEAAITREIEAIESLRLQLLEEQKRYYSALSGILTPLERAKLLIAEERFKNRLRQAMRGGNDRRETPRRHR